jgi:hypothetical protein
VELEESLKYSCVSSLVLIECFIPKKRLKQHCWYTKIVVGSLEAEFPCNKDLNSAKSRSKEDMFEKGRNKGDKQW